MEAKMSSVSTTKMSSKGQVVIPEDIRAVMKLKTGDQFIVIGRGDSVILKTISPPSLDDIEELLIEAQKQAKIAGMKKHDITESIKRVSAAQKKSGE
jgi:AbrB family looped-hinge helix DNA binding protein